MRIMQVSVADNINSATLQSMLLSDAKLAESLHAAGMHPVDAMSILRLRALDHSSNPAIRLDLRAEHCFWLNDLEKDETYRCVSQKR
jgi:hypothetical protein